MPGTYRNLQDVPKNLLKTTKTKLLGENKESHFKTIVFDIYFSLTSKKEVKDLGQLFKKRRLPHTQQKKKRQNCMDISHFAKKKQSFLPASFARQKSRTWGNFASLKRADGRPFFFCRQFSKKVK